MALQDTINELFRQVGPAEELFAVDAYAAEAMWHVAVDDSSVLFAELDAKRRMLVLSADLGRPRADDQARIYALVLRYSHAWTATGGMRISLDGDGGALWLLADHAADTLDLGALGGAIRQFAAVAAAWREIVGKGSTSATAIDDFGFNAIRI
jgi:hypothetical protein